MAKKKSEVELVEDVPTMSRIEIEYCEASEGFTCYEYNDDGYKVVPPLIWHNDTLDGLIKQLAQEKKMKVVISIQLAPL